MKTRTAPGARNSQGAARLSLLGFPRAVVNGSEVRFKRRKSLALLAYLAVGRRPQPRAYLANLFWPHAADASAGQNLRNVLADIRATPAADFLTVDYEKVALAETVEVDLEVFHAQVERIHDLNAQGQVLPEGWVVQVESVVQLYAGGFLAGFRIDVSPEFDDWQYLYAQRYQQDAFMLLSALAQHYVMRGMSEPAHRVLRQWLTLDPVAEHAHRLLMQLYIQDNAPDQALHQYQTLARLLERQEGTQPHFETKALYERIRSGTRVYQMPGGQPSRKLVRSFLPGQPSYLLGREPVIAALKHHLIAGSRTQDKSIVAITGELGAGKTALAASLAYDPDVQAAFKDGILWASLGPKPDAEAVFRAWASVLEIGELRGVHPLEYRAMHFAAAVYGENLLLIVDNVWALHDAQLFALAKTDTTVVLTTRFPAIARHVTASPESVYNLPPLSEQAGIQLLSQRAPSLASQFPDQMGRLVRIYRGLPLALNLIAQVFNRRNTGVADDVLRALFDPRSLLDEPFASEQPVSRQPSTLRATLETLWAQIPEPVRQRVVAVVHEYEAPYELQGMALQLMLDDEGAGVLDNLTDGGLCVGQQESVRLNPFLIALLLDQPRGNPG